MKIAIIGAGFTGLAAGYRLTKEGKNVTIFEFEKTPGGLALGFKEKKWDWSIERHYHHWFTNDESVLSLAAELGYEVVIKRPKTSTYVDSAIYQLDSPISLLLFNKLNILDRLRTGIVLGYLKITPYWGSLEKVTAKNFILKYMGEKSWEVLWKPLFEKKFSEYSDKIPASWFWARIKKRTPSLAYPKGGFLEFAKAISLKIEKYNGKINYGTAVFSITKKGDQFEISTNKGKYLFDKVICTLPFYTFLRITRGLPKDYVDKLLQFKGIGAVNLLLSLKKQFLEDGTYWLNINKTNFPFLALVEHTNFMDLTNYNNEHLLYIGNYLPQNHKYFKKDSLDLLEEYYPYLKTINPRFDKTWLNNIYLFKTQFAQPIITLNYSNKVPKMTTPLKDLFLANMEQVYPWDRGTNYAVEFGEKVAKLILNTENSN